MKRVAAMIVLLTALVVGAGFAAASPTRAHKTKLTVWVGWSQGTELITFKKLIAEYEKICNAARAEGSG